MLVRQAEKEGGKPVDITPKDFGVRTVAQEYGGGAFSISGDVVIFSNYKDQRLYKNSMSSAGQSFTISCPLRFSITFYLGFSSYSIHNVSVLHQKGFCALLL